VYYGGRFSTSKRVNDLADVIDAFYRFGRDVQFVVTTGSLDGNKRAKFVERFPEVELHVGLSQDDAWRVMASCHASVCFSTHELFGMAFWEQMAAGLSVVMLAARWNHDLLPPDYPRVAQSPLHAASLLRTEHTVWRNGGLQGVDSEYAKFVRRMYDADSNMKRLRDLVMERAERLQWTASLQYDAGSRRELKALVRQVLPDCGAAEMMPLWEFWHLLRGQSRVGHNVVGARMKWAKSNATLDAVRIARTLGWHDAKGPDGEPVLVNGGV
jgi:glycosyltransferase involved in cell wall biosynthesis